jgi:hypothetical protein
MLQEIHVLPHIAALKQMLTHDELMVALEWRGLTGDAGGRALSPRCNWHLDDFVVVLVEVPVLVFFTDSLLHPAGLLLVFRVIVGPLALLVENHNVGLVSRSLTSTASAC